MHSFLTIGAGAFGAIVAGMLSDFGRKCLAIEIRNHIVSNTYTQLTNGMVGNCLTFASIWVMLTC